MELELIIFLIFFISLSLVFFGAIRDPLLEIISGILELVGAGLKIAIIISVIVGAVFLIASIFV